MKVINVVIMSCLILGCNFSPTKKIKVQHAGALKMIMHHGDLQGKASLDTLVRENLYAIGALDSLRGEIWIENGKTLISRVQNDSLIISNDPNVAVPLLVYSRVNNWAEQTLKPGGIETLIARVASDANLSAPFPFMLRGKFEELDYHVINFKGGEDILTDHKANALKGSLDQQDVVVLGFYSDQHMGIFTHHGSNVHMHVRNASGTIMGHVDSIEIGNSTITLLLPDLTVAEK